MVLRVLVLSLPLLLAPVAAPAQHQHGHEREESEEEREHAPPILDGMGAWKRKVTTAGERTQMYFNQGLNLYYGFNHDEAIRSFGEAAELDADCAIAWWGVAISAGPNINLPMDEAHAKTASEAIAKAVALLPKASEPERAYIEALRTRYSDDPAKSRASLDSAYAKAMKTVARKYPNDADAQTLYAESMMILNAWNYWTHDGKANPGTSEIISTLESVLKKTPNHPGANHFYIHAMEASPTPDRATAAAKRLETLVPGAGHLVHMPSHIYARTGRYEDSRMVNHRAAQVDERYIAEHNPQGVYSMMYYPHNIHFIWFSACMLGRSSEAMEAARKVAERVPTEMAVQMPMVEFIPPTPILTLARFGRWDEALREPAPAPQLRYSTGLWHYARGLALAATGKTAEARTALDSVRAIAVAMPPDQMVSINYAKPLLRVAVSALNGEIAEADGKQDDAIAALRVAVAAEDSLHYDEPPTWCYPVRQMLGAALLKAGQGKEAETVYRDDLKRHPGNGWSLFGLAQSLKAQGKTKEATDAEARFTKAWSYADVKLTASAY